VYFISDQDTHFQSLRARFRLEHGLILAGIVSVIGIALFGVVVGEWAARGFGTLSEERLAILGATLIAVAAQIFFTSFMLSILGLRRRPDDV
jgi:hypothetical protein